MKHHTNHVLQKRKFAMIGHCFQTFSLILCYNKWKISIKNSW